MQDNNINFLEEFYGKLPDKKINFSWNENPIRMDSFLKFLKVPTTRSYDHLGSDNGWTRLNNNELGLVISGGIPHNIEYLDTIQFGKNLSNPYNNYVNPFYLWEIFTEEGKIYFYNYYEDEIRERVNDLFYEMNSTKKKLKNLTAWYNKINTDVECRLKRGK